MTPLQIESGSRRAALQVAMEGAATTMLVVLGRGLIAQYGYLQYLANYCPIVRLGALVLRVGHAPVLVLPTEADVVLCAGLTTVADIRIATSGDDGRGGSSLARLIKALAAEMDSPPSRIGVVGLEDILIAGEFSRWTGLMPGVRFTSETALVTRLKARKSPLDILELQHAAAIADAGLEALCGVLRGGGSFREASGAAEQTLRSQGAGEVLIFISQGPFYRHRPPAGHPKPGDLLTVFVEGSSETGYWTELARLIAIGPLDAPAARLAICCQNAIDAAEQRLTAGATGADIHAVITSLVSERGFTSDVGFGHGIGVDHDLPAISPASSAALEPGMVVSLHPHVTQADRLRGASLGEAFVVTEGRPIALSRTTRDVITIEPSFHATPIN